jgi:16S rRNA (cytosine1402-N4)-methyltransferase
MSMPAVQSEFQHVTVMLREVVQVIAPRPGGIYVDLTAGGGGHAEALLKASQDTKLIALDRDPLAVAAARRRLSPFGERAAVIHAAFADAEAVLERHGVSQVDGLVADLGVSSPQLDSAERGMSFRQSGPLDMRMDPTSGETALELIVRLSQDELADVIYQYGEERRSRRLARCIKQALAAGELETTTDLRRAIVRAVGPRRVAGLDPATRTFQALRLAVNSELTELSAALDSAPRLLRAGGVAVFISFHSLEDRLVKRAFLNRDVWLRLTKKPEMVGDEEREQNPRSRSAKLRAARRVPPATEQLSALVEEIDGAP